MADYYVDSTAANDAGTGVIGDPFKYIYTHANDLAPGDTMYLRGGVVAQAYVEPEILINAANGTDGNPITITPYMAELIVLQPDAHTDPIIYLYEVDWWVLDGLTIDKQDVWGYGINLRGADHNVLINLEIYDSAVDGIHFHSGDYNTIDTCVIHDIGSNTEEGTGVMITGGNGNTVQNCTIYDCMGDCIHLYELHLAISDTLIDNNLLYTTLGDLSENAVDVKRGNPTITNNVMHGFRFCPGTGGASGSAGSAVVVHRLADGAAVSFNEIYDSVFGIWLTNSANNTTIMRNLIHDLFDDPAGWGQYGILMSGTVTNVQILQNTLANIPVTSIAIGASVTDLDVRNNLFYDTADVEVDGAPDYTADYNGWFTVDSRLVGANDTLGADPDFVDEVDFELEITSDAIDAGVDIGLPFYGTAPDLGYWELWGDPPPTPPAVATGVMVG